MTRIRPAPFIPLALYKIIPSLAPPRWSKLEQPPHLINLLSRYKGVDGRYIAQRRRLIQTGTADLFYKVSLVGYRDGRVANIRAYVYYRGYPVYKTPRWLPYSRIIDQTWDFVSSRGKLLVGSDFMAERQRALELPGVVEMLKELAPLPEQQLSDPAIPEKMRRPLINIPQMRNSDEVTSSRPVAELSRP